MKTLPSPTDYSVVASLQQLLGPVVFIPCKGKKPIRKGWQHLTLADMTPSYIEKLNGRNIAVLLGEPSNHLCTIDCDNEEFLADMLRLNPAFADTLRTRRMRGANLWIRITGDYWSRCAKIKHRENGGQELGEFRAGGSTTMINGHVLDQSKGETEPTEYRMVVNAAPVSISFADIHWPDYVVLPWAQIAVPAADEEHVKRFGEPIFVSDKGRISINEYGFAGKLAAENLILFEPHEERFYCYNETSGLWRAQVKSAMLEMFNREWQRYAIETGYVSELLPRRTTGRAQSILAQVAGITARENVFERRGDVIHCTNGMLHLLEDGELELRGFSPDCYSRNQIPLAFNQDAACTRFLKELLASALEVEDIDLLHRWCGAVLLGGNEAQRIMLLDGTPGGGKSTFCEIIESIVGPENVCEMRTKQLHERFEIARFCGKTLLAAKDVSGDFLMESGASALKKLVGGDRMDAERKNSNECFKQVGHFAVMIICNSRLRVKLDGDAGAWRRRLLMISYERPKAARPIPEFARKLLAEEGEGILRWMIEGAIRHTKELREHGNFILTPRQTGRVDALLSESDSLRSFLVDCIERDDSSDLWTREITDAYLDYCEARAWQTLPIKAVERELQNLMAEIHRSNKSDKVMREGKRERGYLNVSLKKGGPNDGQQ